MLHALAKRTKPNLVMLELVLANSLTSVGLLNFSGDSEDGASGGDSAIDGGSVPTRSNLIASERSWNNLRIF